MFDEYFPLGTRRGCDVESTSIDSDSTSQQRRVPNEWFSLGFRYHPADTKRWINVDLALVYRLRRRTNVKPTFILRLLSAGNW